MGSPTATMRLTKPTLGADPAPLWPNELNLDMDLIDRAVNQTITINVPDQNVALTADGTTNDQALYQAYAFSGSQSTSRVVTIPNVSRFGRAVNLTTGGFSVILSTGGVGASIPPNGIFYEYWVDGSGNVNLLAPEQTSFVGATQSVGTTFSSSAAHDVISLSLGAGDWDLAGSIGFNFSAGSSANVNSLMGWINTVSASQPALYLRTTIQVAGLLNSSFSVPSQRMVLSTTTTVYLSGYCQFTAGTCIVTGQFNARLMG